MEEKYRDLVDKVWELYDENKNDVLDKQEITKVLKHIILENSHDIDQEVIEKMINDIDKDGNETISKDELLQMFLDTEKNF